MDVLNCSSKISDYFSLCPTYPFISLLYTDYVVISVASGGMEFEADLGYLTSVCNGVWAKNKHPEE
jgi:hypothetical protein